MIVKLRPGDVIAFFDDDMWIVTKDQCETWLFGVSTTYGAKVTIAKSYTWRKHCKSNYIKFIISRGKFHEFVLE